MSLTPLSNGHKKALNRESPTMRDIGFGNLLNNIINNVISTQADIPNVSPEKFGAKGNAFYLHSGIWYENAAYTIRAKDDTQAVQDAIDYCTENGYALSSRYGKSYMVTDRLTFIDRIKMPFNQGRIVAGDIIDYMIYINKLWSGTYHAFGDWENIVLDGANKAQSGFRVENGSREQFSNLEINNCTEVGFHHNHMHEAIVRDSHIYNCPLGVRSNGTDSVFDNVNGRECETFILATEEGRANFYRNCHAWLQYGTILGSIFADLYAPNHFLNCYPDTYQYGYRIRGQYVPTTIIGGEFQINEGYWNNKMQPEDKAYVMYFDRSLDTKYINISGDMKIYGPSSGFVHFSNIQPNYFPGKNISKGIKKYGTVNYWPRGMAIDVEYSDGKGVVNGTDVSDTNAALLDFSVTALTFTLNTTTITLNSAAGTYTTIDDIASAIQTQLTAANNSTVVVTASGANGHLILTSAAGQNIVIASGTGTLANIGLVAGTTYPPPTVYGIRNILSSQGDNIIQTNLIFKLSCSAGNKKVGMIDWGYRPRLSAFGSGYIAQDGSYNPTVAPALPPTKTIGASLYTTGEIYINTPEALTNAIIVIQMSYETDYFE